ncbi:unnamed protein product [Microthlaspi erraticum]|uniref:Uncharacterized protein n=1 Tax=Microthlaspi erraticum TaxID=1685480 RepID=A0A6D2HLR4_9BRAS|nr:unnamed protein product [Microthlaspi erraticum]
MFLVQHLLQLRKKVEVDVSRLILSIEMLLGDCINAARELAESLDLYPFLIDFKLKNPCFPNVLVTTAKRQDFCSYCKICCCSRILEYIYNAVCVDLLGSTWFD